ncbi:MAG: hypothetical protein H7338_14420 [Candidatus Sericytochromatia bacterium]|nr:hypothetical protein [Candidatus Sericytochromatia bacterium]
MSAIRPAAYRVFAGVLMLGWSLSACTITQTANAPAAASSAQSKARTSLTAQVLLPQAIPADLITATLAPAQKAADDASRRRGIDYFVLHGNPVALRLRTPTAEGAVISYLGTSKDRHDLNVELRALIGAGPISLIMNYTGPVTLGKRSMTAPATTALPTTKANGLHFELLTGLPGSGVTEAYGDFLGHLGEHLRQRYNVASYAFDDGPFVFAVTEANAPIGFVFCNQASRLVLGERKYADVQAVTALDMSGNILANYALIGFNAKTAGAEKNPIYRVDTETPFGSLIAFGDL